MAKVLNKFEVTLPIISTLTIVIDKDAFIGSIVNHIENRRI
jgi:hypothetical protein